MILFNALRSATFPSTGSMLHFFNSLCEEREQDRVICLNNGAKTMHFSSEEGVEILKAIEAEQIRVNALMTLNYFVVSYLETRRIGGNTCDRRKYVVTLERPWEGSQMISLVDSFHEEEGAEKKATLLNKRSEWV